MRVNTEPLDWAEVVLHVLAHLPETGSLPSSLYSSEYVKAASAALGDAQLRQLGSDIPVLSNCLCSHGRLAAVQLLTRLHPNIEEAAKHAHLGLRELVNTSVADCETIESLVGLETEAELLRCAALLEAPHWQSWPMPPTEELAGQVASRLPRLFPVAPVLEQTTIRFLRVLGRRGRAWPDEIWIGAPAPKDEEALVCALWQAAHEAVVLETFERVRLESLGLGEREVEGLSVARLARRAARQGLGAEHQRWLVTCSAQSAHDRGRRRHR
jgi:hypothetical protein